MTMVGVGFGGRETTRVRPYSNELLFFVGAIHGSPEGVNLGAGGFETLPYSNLCRGKSS